jgi:tRNA U54 and U55 pseudouridine synthase Pus10
MKIHHIRHNRNLPFSKQFHREVSKKYEEQIMQLIKETPITLTINKKKFKLWI